MRSFFDTGASHPRLDDATEAHLAHAYSRIVTAHDDCTRHFAWGESERD
jgi:hypothetical protein